MEEKYKQFEIFDWVKSSEWQNYYNNLYPKPQLNRIVHYKKKFYKLKIDQEFDITYEYKELEEDKPFEKVPERLTPKEGRKGVFDQMISCAEGFIIMTFFFAFLMKLNSKHLALATMLIGMFRRVGFIKFRKDYLHQLVHNEEFQTIFYILILYVNGRNDIIFYFPITILLFINICEYFRYYLTILKFLIKYFEKILNKKEFLLDVKAKIEVFIAFYFVLGVIMNYAGFISCASYLQYLRTKYHFNKALGVAFADINRILWKIKDHSLCPNLITSLINGVQALGCYLVKRN